RLSAALPRIPNTAGGGISPTSSAALSRKKHRAAPPPNNNPNNCAPPPARTRPPIHFSPPLFPGPHPEHAPEHLVPAVCARQLPHRDHFTASSGCPSPKFRSSANIELPSLLPVFPA